MSFLDKISDVFTESPIDPIRKTLDPIIFDKNEKLDSEMVKFFKDLANDFNDNIAPIIGKCLIKGSILSYQWLSHTDVDVLFEIDEATTDHQWDVIEDQIEERYGDLVVPGTKHPVQIFANRGKYDISNADGVYDLYKGWVKGPYVHEFDINQYMDQFEQSVQSIDLKTGELMRDLIDYDILKDMSNDDIKGLKAQLKSKLDEIDSSVDELLYQRNKVKRDRHNAFDRDMTPEEIKKFGSKNLLPANVVQKMLERYHYMTFIGKMKELKNDDRDKISDEDVEELNSIFSIDDKKEDLTE